MTDKPKFEDYESPPRPQVTGSPERIWLVYGELEHDDTHEAICRDGEVTWCEDSQFDTDQEYVRADMAYSRAALDCAAAIDGCDTLNDAIDICRAIAKRGTL